MITFSFYRKAVVPGSTGKQNTRHAVVLIKPVSLLTSHMVLAFTHNLDLVSAV